MAKTTRWRKVPMDIHNDPAFRRLPLLARYLLLHLHTHPQMTSMGCMRHTPEGLAGELCKTDPEIERDAVLEAFRQLIDAGFVLDDDDAPFLALCRYLEWSPPSSLNVVKSWGGLLELIPRCDTQVLYFQDVSEFVAGYGEGFGDALPDAMADAPPRSCGIIRDQRSEGSEDPSARGKATGGNRKLTPQQAAARAIGAVFEDAGGALTKVGAFMGLLGRYRKAPLPAPPDDAQVDDPPLWWLCRDLAALDLAGAGDPETYALKALGNALKEGRGGRVRSGPRGDGQHRWGDGDVGLDPATAARAAALDDALGAEP
ncbi:MAG: hypothetical protein AAGN66_11065 [Acidobacteriota bacterium]